MRVLSSLAVLVLAGAALAGAAGEVLRDRVVAMVDGEAILASDIERSLALGMMTSAEGESGRELRRRVLDALIDERLRLHEVERYGAGRVSVEEVERQLEAIRDRLGGADLDARLAELGLDEDALRHLVTRQLRVLGYIEERLSPRVFVTLEDIERYYEDTFKAEMERHGFPLPPLDEVREAIRVLLREKRLNEEIDTWTEELRLEADIVDHFDRAEGELPPLVRRIERP